MTVEQVYRKKRLAMACRIVAAQGWGIGCGMQLSVSPLGFMGHRGQDNDIQSRDPVNTSSIWVIPAGRALAAMTSGDLIQISIENGSILHEEGKNWGCTFPSSRRPAARCSHTDDVS